MPPPDDARATRPAAPRTIAIAIDDAGLQPGINTAALRLAEAGRAQAIGCIVGGPAWAEGAAALKPLDPRRVDLGLHLDFCDAPLTRRWRWRPLVIDSLLRRLDARALRTEIEAQLDRFDAGIGRPPAYVDGHRHVHQLPQVREQLLQALDGRYGRHRPWLRATRPAAPSPREAGAFKPWVIGRLGGPGLARLAARGGHRQNRGLLGVYDLTGGRERYRRLLAAWLAAARDGDLLMCHPAAPADADDPLAVGRNSEFEVLADPGLPALLQQCGIVLRPMSAILGLAA